jgi:protein TonB
VERRLRYPGGTTAAGTARIALSISSSGRLSGARLTASTGHPALDRAAIAAVRDARYPRAPRALPAGTYSFTVPLTLRP